MIGTRIAGIREHQLLEVLLRLLYTYVQGDALDVHLE